MRTTRDIESLLIWAYRDELSKRFTSSAEGNWAHIEDYGQLGGIGVRASNTPQRYDHGEPHPDAIAIETAIGALPKVAIDWDLSREALMGDLAPLLGSRDVLLLGSINTAALVTMHATMATRPDWHPEHPRPYFVPSTKHAARPSIVGDCRGKNLYTSGSFCPLRWDPSPITIALARADYAAWHHGLTTLARSLTMRDHVGGAPAAPAQPWLTGEPRSRIFLVGQHGRERPLPLKPHRETSAPPAVKRRASPVRHVKAAET